jgi:hypothetical protein
MFACPLMRRQWRLASTRPAIPMGTVRLPRNRCRRNQVFIVKWVEIVTYITKPALTGP